MPLRWSYLEHVARSDFEGFECARSYWWEQEVERTVREFDYVEPPEYILVGLDSFGPAVFINFYVDGSSCKILIVGTAKRAQKQGYGLAAVRHVLGLLTSGHFGEVDEVWGLVHRLNTRSKSMMRQCGFAVDRQYDENFEFWALSI